MKIKVKNIISNLKPRIISYIKEVAPVTITFIILFVVIFKVSIISGVSMEPTLVDGNICIFNNIKPNIARGEIIMFKLRDKKSMLVVKRIIGIEGDTIDIDFDKGIVYVNGEIIEEDYIKELTYKKSDIKFPLVVKKGTVFVLGDNRNNSMDSRYSRVGLVDIEDIVSSYLFTIY